jgi:AraC-like DNA-binding protein
MKQHLILQELTLQPSAEELPVFNGWVVARLAEGLGYWLQHDVPPTQLAFGDGFIAASDTMGRLRASQLDPLKLQFFTVQPQHLDGVLTVAEWHQIEIAHRKSPAPVLFFRSTDSIGQKFTRLVNLSHGERLPLRCALLQLWAAATADSLLPQDFATDNGNKLRGRFWRLFSQMTKFELCLSSPDELARQINCSERHFRGLFRREFGVSLHTYQAELRLQHGGRQAGEAELKTSHSGGHGSISRPVRYLGVPEAKDAFGHPPDEDGHEIGHEIANELTGRGHASGVGHPTAGLGGGGGGEHRPQIGGPA